LVHLPSVSLDGESLTLDEFRAVALGGARVAWTDAARERVRAARGVIDRAVVGGEAVYGVNTGFGNLAGVRIAAGDLATLQERLVVSHAAGVGEPLPETAVRGMLLLRANTLARGHSGVREAIVDGLLALLNAGLHPVVPSRGSVGASGDLAPLAHLALPLLGRGEVFHRGRRREAADALAEEGLAPVVGSSPPARGSA
jgi:histidine ammonia-lyase